MMERSESNWSIFSGWFTEHSLEVSKCKGRQNQMQTYFQPYQSVKVERFAFYVFFGKGSHTIVVQETSSRHL